MLWYKAWLETRSRFLIFLCSMAAFVSYVVYRENDGVANFARLDWYYRTLQMANNMLAAMWVAAVLFLMMGGLLRERAMGTASFTLALPVSRTRLMRVRILFGLLQALALAILPWGAMFLVAAVTGKGNSISWALFHVAMLTGGGVVFFGMALLASSLVEGEYTVPAVTFGVFFADAIGLGSKPLRMYSPWNFMLGTDYFFFDRSTQSLIGSIPWVHMMANITLAVILTAVAIKVIQRKEF
jgi:ABC-2 type transport system permease protein